MVKFQRKIILVLYAMFVISLVNIGILYAQDNIITVYCDKEIGQLNEKVFGAGILSFDTALRGVSRKHSYGYADYGAGVWNPKTNKSVPEVIGLAKEAGISSLRFTTNNHYNWKSAIGKNRNHFLYGIDEFLKTAEEISAEPIFTIPYMTTDVQDAADLVEYLNAPGDDLHPWALKRVINGRTFPYKVKYFEIGNEIFGKVSPEDYAKKYLDYYKAMKAVDRSINIGVSLDLQNRNNWNTMVMDIIKDKMDLGIVHTYPTLFPRIADTRIKKISPLHVFSVSLAVPGIKDEPGYRKILKLLKKKSGRDMPLAITEHNGGFVLNEPVPYRHTLGTALINAELLRIFMKLDNNILMANYHHFSNGHFGMVKAEDNFMKYDYENPIKYVKRPDFYVYELYNKHFGRVLIDADVSSESYDIEGDEPYIQKLISQMSTGTVSGGDLLKNKWRVKETRGITTENNGGIFIIDFNNTARSGYFDAVKTADVQPGRYYRLSGHIKTEGLADGKYVSLMIKGRSLLHRKGSHAQTTKLGGTTDWQYIDVIYKTPSYADSAIVGAYASGKKGGIKGKVYLRDLKLEQVDPETQIPYLSVNSSKSRDGTKIYLMVINKNMNEPVTTLIELENYMKGEKLEDIDSAYPLEINTWTLNGPSVDATNEFNSNTVKINQRSFNDTGDSFSFTFEPHSLTAIEIRHKL